MGGVLRFGRTQLFYISARSWGLTLQDMVSSALVLLAKETANTARQLSQKWKLSQRGKKGWGAEARTLDLPLSRGQIFQLPVCPTLPHTA